MRYSSADSPRNRPSVPWLLTTFGWSVVIGAAAFYFLQWYGTLGILFLITVLASIGFITRFRYPLLIWAMAGLLVGHVILVGLGLLAISRSH